MALLRSDLKSWRAYSHELLNVASRKRSYIYPTSIGWSCIICNEKIHSCPVFQCQNGHLACSSCSWSGKKCTKCSKAEVSRIRNVAVEEMLEATLMTCKNAEFGCRQITNLTDQMEGSTEHEETCEYAPIVCPIPGCLQAGVQYRLIKHLVTKHKTSLMDLPLKEFDLSHFLTLVVLRDPESGTFYLLHQESTALGDTLRVTSESSTEAYDLKVSIGEDADAAKYSFTGVCTSSSQQGVMLLLPKHRGTEYMRTRCTIELNRDDEDDEETEMEDEDDVPRTTLCHQKK